MFISTCGFGSTGSSAVSDYLRECVNVQVLDHFEFTISTATDGLEDLEYFIMERSSRGGSSIVALQRFESLVHSKIKGWTHYTKITPEKVDKITQKFLNDITQVKFVGFSPRINRNDNLLIRSKIGGALIQRRIMPMLEKKGIINKNIDFYPLDEVRMSVKPANFHKAARQFVSSLLTEMGFNTSANIVCDQAFSGVDPAKSFRFFHDPYAIVVDRDPRDLYIFAKKKLLSKGRFMPSERVEDFIEYYKLLRNNQPYKEPNPRILCIRFEDMIYDYERTVAKIDKFLSVKNIHPKTVFKPEMSAANTNLSNRFKEFKEDVKKIENALPEYIYHFENHPIINNNGKMFYGRALAPR